LKSSNALSETFLIARRKFSQTTSADSSRLLAEEIP
jgi:hypothetical protein